MGLSIFLLKIFGIIWVFYKNERCLICIIVCAFNRVAADGELTS